MSCAGTREARAGLVADMVKLRENLAKVINEAGRAAGDDTSLAQAAIFAVGAHQVALDKLAAAVIALASPCCAGCDGGGDDG